MIAEDFIRDDSVCLVLGDNVFHGDFERPSPDSRCVIYGYEVKDPRAYGVVELDSRGKTLSIEEKPVNPKSNYAIPGLYFFDELVTDFAKAVEPSPRGELEITDIMRMYMTFGSLETIIMPRGVAWLDAGTPHTLFQASAYVQAVQERQGIMIGCIEEECYKAGFINTQQYKELIEKLPKSDYRSYLERTL